MAALSTSSRISGALCVPQTPLEFGSSSRCDHSESRVPRPIQGPTTFEECAWLQCQDKAICCSRSRSSFSRFCGSARRQACFSADCTNTCVKKLFFFIPTTNFGHTISPSKPTSSAALRTGSTARLSSSPTAATVFHTRLGRRPAGWPGHPHTHACIHNKFDCRPPERMPLPEDGRVRRNPQRRPNGPPMARAQPSLPASQKSERKEPLALSCGRCSHEFRELRNSRKRWSRYGSRFNRGWKTGLRCLSLDLAAPHVRVDTILSTALLRASRGAGNARAGSAHPPFTP